MSQIKQISECFIRPEFEPDDSKKYYHLGALSLSMLSMEYIHSGYLFRKPYHYSAPSYLQKLKNTLSKALVHFYPLAGRFETQRFVDEHSSCVYVDCSKGPGAKLIHAAAPHVTIHDVVSPNADVPTIIHHMFDLGERLVNHDGHTKPLLSVQVTEIDDGVFLGFSANHSIVDGTSYTHFHEVLSVIFMGLSRPIIIRKPAFLDNQIIIKMPYLEPSKLIITRSTIEIQLRERFFQFSTTCMKKLKAKANVEAAANNSSQQPAVVISSYKALSAFVWKCITRARDLPSHELTTCALPVNLRPRLNPNLSQDYFGNYFTEVKACAEVGELLDNNVGWAAMLLHQALSSLDDKAAERAIFDEDPQLLHPNLSLHSNNIVMAGSSKFDIYGPEFGLGPAVVNRGGFGNKWDGKVNTYACRIYRGEEYMRVNHMEKFTVKLTHKPSPFSQLINFP